MVAAATLEAATLRPRHQRPINSHSGSIELIARLQCLLINRAVMNVNVDQVGGGKEEEEVEEGGFEAVALAALSVSWPVQTW